MTKVDRSQVGIGGLELEVSIAAPRQRVWEALVEETTEWWLADFYTRSDAKGFHLEARVGGRMYEDWGDGAGLLWYTVIGIAPPESLDLAGHLTPSFGGPAKTYMKITLEDEGEGTLLRVSDSILGRVGEDSVEQFRSGWEYLFTQGLKAHVEKG